MIPDDVVERVAQAADIVQVISEYVPLKRVGNSWRGPCPFHQGTNRNFSVMPTGGYVCFVCGEKGSVFTFLQKRLGLSFVEAVRLVGEKSGIDVREAETRRGDGPDPRERYWELNAAAAEYFSRVLWDEPAGQPARDYLEQRHIARDLSERVGLGFAPREQGALADHLRTLGFDDARQLEGGLMLRREESEEPRSRFRGRLMFPIWDASGRAVGFGGRLLGPGEPKYLNSAESPTFAKGRVLYGLNWAKHAIRRDERVLVVEGYFDAVRLIASGVESVVAPLGTALTEDQAALLARYTKNVFLLYDSDKAGLKATFRSGDVLLEHGLSVRVVTLPDGEDPDTFVDRHGRDALERHLDAAADIFDRKVQILERAGWFADLHRRRIAIDRLLPTLRATSDPLTRELYVARASEVSGVPRDVLVREIETPSSTEADRASPARAAGDRASGAGRGGARPSDRRRGERRVERDTVPVERGASAEGELVRVMLHRRALVDRLAERVGREKFREPRYREVYGALLDLGADATLEELASKLSAAATAVVDAFVAEPGALLNVDRTFDESLRTLMERDLDERSDEIEREIVAAPTDEEKDALIAEKRRISEERRSLGAARWRIPRTR